MGTLGNIINQATAYGRSVFGTYIVWNGQNIYTYMEVPKRLDADYFASIGFSDLSGANMRNMDIRILCVSPSTFTGTIQEGDTITLSTESSDWVYVIARCHFIADNNVINTQRIVATRMAPPDSTSRIVDGSTDPINNLPPNVYQSG